MASKHRLRTLNHQYDIADAPLKKGGFGEVCDVVRVKDQKPFVVKKCLKSDDSTFKRFENEIALLRWMNEWTKLNGVSPYPCLEDEGTDYGRRFYVMERLEELDLAPLQQETGDVARIDFIVQVARAVHMLHAAGYVHYDIKPQNILVRRQKNSPVEYVLSDFGSVHRLESSRQRTKNSQTVSMVSGRRISPKTPGYADPCDFAHTVRGDIYSLGQVIRDLFTTEVPLHWSKILNKCISRREDYRYEDVGQLIADVQALDRQAATDIQELNEYYVRQVAEIERRIDSLPVTTVRDWAAICEQWQADAQEGLTVLRIHLSLGGAGCFYRVKEPLRLPKRTLLQIVGDGRLDAEITGEKGSVILLRDHATFNNTADCRLTRDRTVYVLGDGCYVNFVNLPASQRAAFHDAKRVFRAPWSTAQLSFGGAKTFGAFRRAEAALVQKCGLPKSLTDSLSENPARRKLGLESKVLAVGHVGLEPNPLTSENDLVKSALWGAIVGNIVGSRFEYQPTKDVEFDLFTNECRFEADSVMSLAVAEALLLWKKKMGNRPPSDRGYKQLGKIAADEMTKLAREVARQGYSVSYGERFQQWLSSPKKKPSHSWGNGAAMRIGCVGVVAENEAQVKDCAKAITDITHNHPEGEKGGMATAMAVWLARKGGAITKERIRQGLESYYPQLRSPSFTLSKIRPSYVFTTSCQGSVPQALQAFLESSDYQSAIRNAISLGGDADTLAAIAGAVAGVFYGIPKKLVETASTYLLPEMRMRIECFEKEIKEYL